jgi:hypothetical protein
MEWWKMSVQWIVFLPIAGGFIGFFDAAFFCCIYNLVAPRIGGIAFELTPRCEN